MKTDERRYLTDNAWVNRVGDLRQEADDQYNPADATPQQWVEWYTAQEGEEYDVDDCRVLLDRAEQLYEDYQARSAAARTLRSIPSEARSAASRANGRLGGRPRKVTP
jgi:hypothetical protein